MAENKIHSWFASYINFVQRHLFLTLAVILLTAVGSVLLSSKLSIKGDLKELLPDNYQSVKELNKALDRIGGVGSLIIVAEGPSFDANRHFMNDLAGSLNSLPEGTIRYLDYKTDEVKEFYEKYFLHYLSAGDLSELYDSVERRIDYEKLSKARLFVNFADEEPLVSQVEAIKERNQKNYSAPVQTYENYYGGEWGRMLIMIVRPYESNLSVDRARGLISSVEDIVASLNPSSYDSDLKIGYCGNVKSTVEEYDTLKKDILSTAFLCVTLISLAIIVFFLRVRIVFILAATLFIALSWTFALTYLFIGYLNSQTAFLGSIILGTGINYGIIVMARYVEERRKRREHAEAMKFAVRHTMSATFLAAATTAVAFLVLLLAKIKGLNQFGLIGAAGVILCWIATILVFPAITLATERVRSMVRAHDSPKRRSAVFALLTRGAVHSPAKVVAASVIIVAVSIILVVRFAPNSIEYDFTKLRNKTSVTSGTEALEKRVSKLFKGSMTPAVVLLDRMEDATPVCNAVNNQNLALPEADRRVGSCYSIYGLLPKEDAGRNAELGRFRLLLDKEKDNIERLEGDLKEKVYSIRDSLKAPKLALDGIPLALTKHFEDQYHQKGSVVFINPRAGMLLSDGRNLVRFADTIKDVKLEDGRVLHAAGASMIFSDLVKTIKNEAPILTVASFICVLIFVRLVIRRFQASSVVIISLVLGITSMLGLMALFKIKLNFFNFIALPLTFGIGVDYAINVVLRLVREPTDEFEHSLRHTGMAVILCSITTIIGYAVLIFANNQALASFGMIAILGEITCISAAIVLAPALMVLFRKRRLVAEFEPAFASAVSEPSPIEAKPSE